MPLPSDTAAAVGQTNTGQDNEGVDFVVASRSLMLDRFPNPKLEKENRHNFFTNSFKKAAYPEKSEAWREFLGEKLALSDDQLLFFQLKSRLMVNMAGSVMENAGLCLDRFSGLPVIPGSATKGCARRMATQQMLARSAEDPIAGTDEFASDLADIAMTFGWTDSEWKSGRKQKRKDGRIIETEPHSDFWWAMAADVGDHSADPQRNSRWAEVSEKTAAMLFKTLHAKPGNPEKPLAPQLPNFAGSVSFLAAWPVKVSAKNLPAGTPPELGRLELDVVTCHHGKYYSDNPGYASAPDTEDPVPVIFPAVAPAHVFVFALLPLRNCPSNLVAKARTWLSEGLANFGLGAKTTAGYGWFEDVRQQMIPWCNLERLKAKLRNFENYSDTQKDDVVLNLSDQPDICKAWSEFEPASFEPIKQYATRQGIELL